MRRKLGDGIAYLVLICGAIMMVFSLSLDVSLCI